MKTFIIAAISADGFIARNTHELADWTSKEDKKVFVELTKRAGVMVMGRTTFDTIGRALPGRQTVVYSHTEVAAEGVTTTQESPADLVKRLQGEGYSELAVCGGSAIYSLFLDAGVVDEVYLTVEPILFGSGVPILKNAVTANLRLLESKQLNDNVLLLHYEVQK